MWPFRKRSRWAYLRKAAQWVVELLRRVWSWVVATYARLTGELKRQAVIARLQKADIILASPRTSRLPPLALAYRLLLGAQYVHSMLYIGGGRIIHTTSRHGVVVGRVPRGIYRRNRYAVYRAVGLDERQRGRIVAEALKWKGKRLDYAGLVTNLPSRLFGFRRALISAERERIWCSRLVASAYLEAGVEIVPRERLASVTSEDLAHSPIVRRVL